MINVIHYLIINTHLSRTVTLLVLTLFLLSTCGGHSLGPTSQMLDEN